MARFIMNQSLFNWKLDYSIEQWIIPSNQKKVSDENGERER